MRANRLTEVMGLAASIDELWDFFSTAQNLAPLTPPDQKLQVGKGGDQRIVPGLEIEISVAPMLGIRTGWRTLIMEVEGPEKAPGRAWFRDIQESGPFALWDHTHAFRALPDGGTAVMDVVEYKLPAGRLGQAVAGFWVRRQVQGLFAYRKTALHEKFGPMGLPQDLLEGWEVRRDFSEETR